eukprot:181131_1
MLKTRKLVVMGFSMVGKTATCTRLCSNEFQPGYEPTCETTFKTQIKHRGCTIELVITDTQGQDDQDLLRTQYGLKDGFILMYSVTSKRSLQIVKAINDKLLALTGNVRIPRILVGNKVDMEKFRRVTTEEGRALAREMGCLFLECSAVDGVNIHRVFELILEEIDRSNGMEEEKHETSMFGRFSGCLSSIFSPAFVSDSGRCVTLGTILNFLLVMSGIIGFSVCTNADLANLLIVCSLGLLLPTAVGYFGNHNNGVRTLNVAGILGILILLAEAISALVVFNESEVLPNHRGAFTSIFILAAICQVFSAVSQLRHARTLRMEMDEDWLLPAYAALD